MRVRSSSRSAGAVVAFALLITPALARAADPAAAREQLKIGYLLAQDGKCEEALPHLTESLRLDVKAITLINLADCEEKTGRLASALGHWVDARARAQAEGAGAIEEEAERRAKALEGRMPRLTIQLSPDAPKGTEVIRDGVALGGVSLGVALPVDPGEHTVVVRTPGHFEASKTISIAEGESHRIDVAPGDPAPVASAPSAIVPVDEGRAGQASPLVWIGFGTAAAGVAVGAVTGLVALGHSNEAERDCPNLSCRDASALESVETGRMFGTLSTVAFVVAGLGAGVGIYGLLSGGDARRDAAKVSFRFGPTGGAIGGRF